MARLLWAIVSLLLLFWLIGLLLHIGGAFIHLVLLVVLALVIINVLTGRGARV